MSEKNKASVWEISNAERISELEKKQSDIRSKILNIKPNNELFIKIMRMQQQIDKLRLKLENSPSNFNLKNQIAELKEDYKRNSNIIDAMVIKQLNLEKVLREFLIAYKEVNMEREHNGCLYSIAVRELLEKLDGETETSKTEKKDDHEHQFEISAGFEICSLCGHISPKRIKDSGGEKESLNERGDVANDFRYASHEDDSKLPEYEFISKIDMIDYLKRHGYIIKKRENEYDKNNVHVPSYLKGYEDASSEFVDDLEGDLTRDKLYRKWVE